MKKYLALFVCLLLIINSGQIAFASSGQEANSDNSYFAGGSGSASDPWQISSPDHLFSLHNYLGETHADRHFELTGDIDLGLSPWNDGAGWQPIGTLLSPFQGTLNGNGFRIKNLFIRQTEENSPVGLFGVTMDAQISRVALQDAAVTGTLVAGILSGISMNGFIEEVYVTGHVAGISENISVSSTESDQDQFQGIGGLAGISFDTRILNTYAQADVMGSLNVGGLIGHNEHGLVENAYAAGTVDAEVADADPDPEHWGGLIGYNQGDPPVNSFYDSQRSGLDDTGKGLARTTDELKIPNTFESWDLVSIWGINRVDNQGYPFLKWQGYTSQTILTYSVKGGKGTLTAQSNGTSVVSGDWVEENGRIIFTATPDAGYKIKNWIVNNLPMDVQDTFFILEERLDQTNVQVSFEPANQVNFNVQGTGGRMVASTHLAFLNSGEWVDQGEAVDFQAFLDPGYKLESWTVDDVIVEHEDTVFREHMLSIPDVSADITVSANITELEAFDVFFEQNDGRGNLTAFADGAEIKSGDQVMEQSEVVFKAVPDVNYQVAQWQVNGETVMENDVPLTDRELVLGSLEEAIDVSVSFALMPAGYDAALFTFLAPVDPNGKSQKTMDNTLVEHLSVEIYELESNRMVDVIISQDKKKNTGLQIQKKSYNTNWQVNNVESGERYRMNVFMQGSQTLDPILLGSVDFTVGDRQKQTLSVNDKQMLRIAFWVANDPVLRTRQMNLLGKGALEIAQVLQQEFDCDPREAAHLLKQEGFDIVGISNGLKQVYELTPAEAAIVLQQENWSATQTATAMRDSYEQDENETAQSLRSADYDSLETGHAVMDAFAITEEISIGTLKKAGFDVYEVGNTAWAFATQQPEEFVKLLNVNQYSAEELIMIGLAIKGLPLQAKLVAASAAGYLAMDLAVALRDLDDSLDDVGFARLFKASGFLPEDVGDYFDQYTTLGLQSVASVLHTAGYSAVETVEAIRYSLDEMKATGIPILRDAAYDVIDISGVLKENFGQSLKEIAGIFYGEFSAEDTALALKTQFIDTPLEIVGEALHTVGYASGEIALAAKNVYNATGELAAKVLRQIGVGAEEVGEQLKDVFDATDRQVAGFLRSSGFIPDDVAGAIGSIFGYGGEGVLGVMKGAGYTCNQLASLAKNYYGWTGDYMAEQLKLLGYSADAVGSALKSVYGWGEGAVEDALEYAGYAAGAISDAVGSLFGKIICTELHRQGLMSDTIFEADQAFGKMMRERYPVVMRGYHFLAIPVVKLMQRSAAITKIVNWIATPWANEMAYQMGVLSQGSFAGKIIMSSGMLLCLLTGFVISITLQAQYSLMLILVGFVLINERKRTRKQVLCSLPERQ